MRKKTVFNIIGFSSIFFLLIASIIVFPRFLWRTDSMLSDVQDAISKKEALNERNDIGITPLMGAAAEGQIESVKLLLNQFAKKGRKQLVKIMWQRAKNPEDLILKAGNTALHYACLWGHTEVIKEFVRRKIFEPTRGRKATPLNDNNDTPLYTIVNSEAPLEIKKQCMDALFFDDKDKLLQKLMINFQNKLGYTPLMRAVEMRDEELVRLLLDSWGRYINFSLKNKDGETALMVAERDGADDTIKDLVRNAAQKMYR